MTVFSAIREPKRLHYISFGIAHLQRIAGPPSSPLDREELPSDVLLAHQNLPKAIAMDILILGCWSIWNQRNGKVFRREVTCRNSWKYMLKKDFSLLAHRTKQKHVTALKDWISSHLGG